jgi:Flp pilus assembly secretin CpaC
MPQGVLKLVAIIHLFFTSWMLDWLEFLLEHKMRNHYFTRSRLVAVALVGVFAVPATSLAAEFMVPMDQVRMVTFRAPVSTVFVGNPQIADITVVDSTRIFLMGKNFGTTNLVALDENGNQISNDRITVQTRTGDVVTLHRGKSQTTVACIADRCQNAPLPGDSAEDFSAVSEQIAAREDEVIAAASSN